MNPTTGSLRAAIVGSNAMPDASGPNQITFSLDPGAMISPTTALPPITSPVIVDARAAQAGPPNVVLDGAGATGGVKAADGLDVNAAGVVIEGLVIQNFRGSGVVLNGGGDTLADDYLGTGIDGTSVEPNLGDGVLVTSPGNVIGAVNLTDKTGTVTTFLANIITSNGTGQNPADGILIQGAGASGNLILGNFIGVDKSGGVIFGNGNGNDGVQITDSSANTIGGTTAGARNVISFNGQQILGTGDGIEIDGVLAARNVIEGNFIGPDFTGASDLGNYGDGVQLVGSPDNTIGGSTSAASNVISGNTNGVEINDATATGNVVAGDLIGTDNSGNTALGNTHDGVQIVDAPGNTIGGTVVGARDVLSGNKVHGVGIDNATASGNLVEGDYVGIGADGTTPLGNAGDGVFLLGAPGNVIGGTSAAARNVISGNGSLVYGEGVDIEGTTATGNAVLGDYIGTDAKGLRSMGNLDGGVRVLGAPDNIIGGIAPGAGNLISGNARDGIFLSTLTSTGMAASGTAVLGNRIGVDFTGQAQLGNFLNGIEINNVANTTIGGPDAGAANVVSGNRGVGIYVHEAGSRGTLIQGNLVGVGASGSGVVGNNQSGIEVSNASGIIIGGLSPLDRNVIAGNGGEGVFLLGEASAGNLVLGNYIGVDRSGLTRAANLLVGVEVYGSSSNVVDGNVIAGNNLAGVNLQSNASNGSNNNLVAGNFIGVNASGTGGTGNVAQGVSIFFSSGNTVGGTTLGTRNVISNNTTQGVLIVGSPIKDPANPAIVVGNTASANLVQGNYIGTDLTGLAGTNASANGSDGVKVSAATGNTIGGTAVGAGNVIAANFGNGVNLQFGANANLVEGNVIGTALGGEVRLANHLSGVLIFGSMGNQVGGSVAGSGNVISGNLVSGVDLSQFSAGNVIEGDQIGTDRLGRFALGNGLNGVTIEGGSNKNIVGGAGGPLTRDVISGNDDNGVAIIQGTDGVVSGNVILGDSIGTDVTGSTAVGIDGKPLGNLSDGVLVNGAGLNAIGDDVVSGNMQSGVVLTGGAGATGNQVFGDQIGTDTSGTRVVDASGLALGNQGSGVVISNAAGNVVGGVLPSLSDVISGNASVGVQVSGPFSARNTIEGNKIGVDASGTFALGNLSDGVQVFDSGGNQVGGVAPGAGNVISANHGAGIRIIGSTNLAFGNALEGNIVGSDASTTLASDPLAKPLGNATGGVVLQQVAGAFLAGNIVEANQGAGVEIKGGGASVLAGNIVGTNLAGSPGLGNAGDGVMVVGSAGNTIGGPSPSGRNLLSANQGNGLNLSGAATFGNVVVGDWIGLDGTGRAPLGNALDGVIVDEAGPGNQITSDVISANGGAGVDLSGLDTGATTVQGDLIGTDATGSIALGNSVGVYLDNVRAITIGGTTPASLNLISGNRQLGVDVFQVQAEAQGNAIQGNWIGPDLAGTNIPQGSTQATGVFVDNAANNLVGGPTPAAGNTISGNATAGVYLFGQANLPDVANRVEGNLVGAFPGLPLSQIPTVQGVGVLVNMSAGNAIGGPDLGNVFAGNGAAVEVVGAPAAGSVVPANVIQRNEMLDNQIGVFLNEASGNLVGGPAAADANIIRDNALEGLAIVGGLATGNKIEGNTITANTLSGAYLDGAVNNVIGGAVPNVISNNGAPKSRNGVGVYLYDDAQGNTISRNQIQKNTAYGVFLYNSARNVPGVTRTGPSKNTFGGNGIADFREFTGAATTTPSKPTKVTRPKKK